MTIGTALRSQSFLYVTDFDADAIHSLLSRAKEIKSHFEKKGQFPRSLKKKQIAMLFSEASTRTRLSFQMAAQRMGAQCLMIDDGSNSSMSKGESFADTFWTLHAMRPDLFVIRTGDDGRLDGLASESEFPIVNAGFGAKAHPTQALLDVMTLLEHRVSMEKQKLLLVGDIRHSRVAQSHFRLAKILKAEVAVCAPEGFLPDESADVKVFSDLDEALSWCTVYCGLRVQFERHSESPGFSRQEFIEKFSLNQQRLKKLPSTSLVIHPGPVNWGVEFQPEVREDKRLLIWQQKENGVYLRAALIEELLLGNSSEER